MKITKFGHCCLLIEEQGTRILTDPGTYSTMQDEVKNIDVIVITHEHADHFHIDSLKKVLEHNPQANIICNSFLVGLLDKENITNYKIVEDGQNTLVKGEKSDKEIKVEAYGTQHAEMHSSIPQSMNTGYFFADRLFYPGDAFTNPQRPVDILALPVAGPWMKISEAIDYGLALKPKKAFPVHDGILVSPGMVHRLPSMIFPKNNIEFIALEIGKEYEL